MDATTRAHVFFVNDGGTMRAVVGASKDRVRLLKEEGSEHWVQASSYEYVARMVPTAGRLTLFDSYGVTGQDGYGDAQTFSVVSETQVSFSILADRDLKDVYAAVFFVSPSGGDPEMVTFGSVGDLPAGRKVKRAVRVRGLLERGWRYRVEFYAEGYAIEQYRFSRIYLDPKSKSLQLPWEARLEQYLVMGKKKKWNMGPMPFAVGFETFDGSASKERGIESIEVNLQIRVDGTVEWLGTDSPLKSEEIAALQADASEWRFFPHLKKGKPTLKKVALPVSQ